MPTFFEIGVGILMVAVAIGLVVAFRRYHGAASATRMRWMMAKLGFDSRKLDSRSDAIMTDVRRRCAKCMSEAQCDRWLVGEAEGENAFCPNAKVFEALLERSNARAV